MTDERKAWETALGEIHERKFPTDPMQEVKKAILERLDLAFWNTMQEYPAIRDNAKINVRYVQDVADKIVIYVQSWMLDGHKVDRIEPESIDFPATPWDFVKQEYAPKWFLERWPVKYNTRVVTKHLHQHYVCPHINIKDDNYPHIAWMYEMSGQKETK